MTDFHQAQDAITKQVLSLVEKVSNPIILIDGRAASGKSTLAASLQNAIFRELEQAPRVIHMDDLYPGWEGLRAGSQYLVQSILQPLRAGKTAHWQIWNWETGQRGSEAEVGNGWREFELQTPLIVEGCASLSRASKELSDLTLWLEVDRKTRRERWDRRDGEKFLEYWPIWETQEDEFYQVEKSKELADLVLTN
jgi:uridine kinase